MHSIEMTYIKVVSVWKKTADFNLTNSSKIEWVFYLTKLIIGMSGIKEKQSNKKLIAANLFF